MATQYTSSKENTNFAKLSWMIVDLCRDLLFEILSKEIPLVNLPTQVSANLYRLKLSREQAIRIIHKPGGVLPNERDVDISVLYTLLRNICPNFPAPTRGWGCPPLAADIQVADDVERIRLKRNVLFGHCYTAALSDTEFHKELSDLKNVVLRLEKHLQLKQADCRHFSAGLETMEASSMDPAQEQMFVEAIQKQRQEDKETRELLSQFKGEYTEEMTSVRCQLAKDQAKLQGLEMQQVQDRQETMATVQKLHDEQHRISEKMADIQREVDDKVDGIHRQVESLSLGEQPTPADLHQDAAEVILQSHLHRTYKDEMFLEVSVIPSYDDVQLSEVFTPIIIREDLETSFNLQARRAGDNRSVNPGQRSQTNNELVSYREMFYQGSQMHRNIYLLGKAGAGKTTFCRHLVDVWCKSLDTACYRNPEVIHSFEFVFLVFCRAAEESHKVVDMILEQLFSGPDSEYQSLVRHVLRTKPERCLVIVDGLDEWAGSPSRSTGPRTPSGLPDRRGLENCVLLTTSRPWRVEALRQGLGKTYRVLEIQGLTNEDMQKLANKIVKARHEGESDVEDIHVDAVVTDFIRCVEEVKLKAVVETPLMLVNVFTLWHSSKSLDLSLCVNYSHMVEALLLRAEGKSGLSDASNRLADIPQLPGLRAVWATSGETLPQCFTGLELCQLYAPLIHKLARLAFDGLFHENKEKSLVFSIPDLEKYFLKSELEVILKVGVFSITAAPSRSRERKATLSFLHKTLQEFLAAVWMAGDSYSDCLPVFVKHCQCVTDVLDFGVFLVFLCGLSPDKGRQVWQYLGEVTASDPAVQQYRAKMVIPYGYVFPLKSIPRLQQLLLQCTAEAKHHRPDFPLNCIAQDYSIQDIYVDSRISVENTDLLLSQAVASGTGIKLLVVFGVRPPPEVLEAISCMGSVDYLVIQSPGHSLPEQQCEDLFTAVSRLSPAATSLALVDLSLEAPSRLIPQALKSLTLDRVRISGMVQIVFPVTITTLDMRGVSLDHGSVTQLSAGLQASSSLQELCLVLLKCRDCGLGCQYQLDISSNTRLHRLELRDLCVDKVQVTPSNLETVKLRGLCKSGAAGSVIPCLHLAPQLTELILSECNVSQYDLSVLCSVLPRLSQLGKLYLSHIHCVDLDVGVSVEILYSRHGYLGICLSPNMSQLREIKVYDVTMSDQAWSDFVRSLPIPPLSQQLMVELTNVNLDPASWIYVAEHFIVTRDENGNDEGGDDVGSSLSSGRRNLDFLLC